MIEKLIALCVRNKFLTVAVVAACFGGGLWALKRIPLDALPDLSDVQVIVYTNWEGQNPNLIEDQVTYPIVSALISAPKVKTVRGYSFFGFSYVYVIFQDGTDLYWARSRVLEYLNGLKGQLPQEVNPNLGPDATGVALLLASGGAGSCGSLLGRRVPEAVPSGSRSGEAGLLRDRFAGDPRTGPAVQRRRRWPRGRVDRARVHGPRARLHSEPRGLAPHSDQGARPDRHPGVPLRRRQYPLRPGDAARGDRLEWRRRSRRRCRHRPVRGERFERRRSGEEEDRGAGAFLPARSGAQDRLRPKRADPSRD